MHYYDATNPAARQFVWQQVRENYYRLGIRVWWLDACEPEVVPSDPDNLRFYVGDGQAVGNIYPLLHEQGFYDGLRVEGEEDIITLGGSGWAGSQHRHIYGLCLSTEFSSLDEGFSSLPRCSVQGGPKGEGLNCR